jgi:uncharacterized cupin superfamily protein
VSALPFIVHVDDVAEVEGAYRPPFDGEKLSLYRDLGRASGTIHAGFSYERLLPGRRTSFTHAHELEEEFVFVVAGTCHVRTIDTGGAVHEVPLRAGHAVAFPAGTGLAHTFVNHGSEDCFLFVHGERRAAERVFYPEDPAYDAHHAATRALAHWTRGTVRATTRADLPVILDFLARKAAFDATMVDVAPALRATEDALGETLFGVAPYAWARLAMRAGRPVGFALYYFRYSSFRARPSIWLDDLYVLEEARSGGVGRAILGDLAAIARAHRCTHMSWTVAARNARGIAFYERHGAVVVDRTGPQWHVEASADVLEQLAG